MTGLLRIGVDLGGTKISAIVFDTADQVLAHCRIPTPRDDYHAVIAAITGLVNQLEHEHGNASVGVGMPGSISPSGGQVQNANSTWMNGQDFQTDLNAALARPVKLANDANCFALSEATDGAGAGAQVVFGVILGTGCGGGVAINQRVLAGPHNIAGEWGHNPLPWPKDDEHPGSQCWCGRIGCLETWISGTGLEQDHGRIAGNMLTGEQIAASAAGGNPEAIASLERHANRLARGLAHVINLLDPDVIILGGGLSNLSQLYVSLEDTMRPYVFCDEWNCAIKPPVHGDDSGVRGAARLWDQEL